MFRPTRWLTILVLLAIVAAACGGSETAGDEGPSTSTPSEVADVTPTAAPDSNVPDRDDEPAVERDDCRTDALAEASAPVEIAMWHTMSSVNAEVLESLVAGYNASQSKVVVTATFQGTYQESFEKYVNTLRSGGDLPDLVQQRETVLQQMVDSKSIVPVQACIDSDGYDITDFTGRLLDQYRIGNVVITMPFQVSNPVLYYDGSDFVAAGLDPNDPPRTFDEVLEAARTLVDAGIVDVGIALDFDAWMVEQWVSMAGAPLVDQDNGRSGRATRALLESDAVGAIYGFLAALRDEGLIKATGRGTQQSDLDKYLAVAFGEAAMTIGSSASLGEIYTQIGAFPDIDLRVGNLPGPTTGGTAVGGGSLYLMADTTDEVRAAVWDFMKWLNEPAQQVVWSAGTGYIPTRQTAYSDPQLVALWAERPGFRVAFDQLATAGPIPGGGGPVIGDHEGVRDAIEGSMEALFAGASAPEAQQQALEGANEAIEDYNRRIGG